jgi:hypothetical protein
MKSLLKQLTHRELEVFAEIAHAAVDGTCRTPGTLIRLRLRKPMNSREYTRILASLERKGLLAQEVISKGVPRRITLIPAR